MRLRVALLSAVAALSAACQPQEAPRGADIEFLQMPEMEGLGLPFSSAVRVDNLLFLSGIIGTDPNDLRPMPGGIGPETQRALEIMRDTVEAFGSSMDRVVKCTVFLADIDEWAAMNEVYVTFFDAPPPARSALGTNGLALGARMEIECIAAL